MRHLTMKTFKKPANGRLRTGSVVRLCEHAARTVVARSKQNKADVGNLEFFLECLEKKSDESSNAAKKRDRKGVPLTPSAASSMICGFSMSTCMVAEPVVAVQAHTSFRCSVTHTPNTRAM